MEELLKELGFDDESINKITGAMKEKQIYTTTEENLDIRYSKLKEKNEELEEDLKAAQDTLSELKSNTKDQEELENSLKEYEDRIEELEAERLKERTEFQLTSALSKEGAQDIDYLIFKLGGLENIELDEEGQVKDLDKTISKLKEEYSNQFQSEKEGEKKIISNKLNDEENKSFTLDEVKNMTTDEINANWDAIKDMDLNQ